MKRLSEVINPPDFLTGAMANLSGQAADPFKIPPGTATQHGEASVDAGSADQDPADDLRDRHGADASARSRSSTCTCPPALGIGSYKVTANFVAGGGLYENANVTYRGVTIGRVESVGLTDDGVVAHMRLNSEYPGAGERHRDGQERVGDRRAVHRPGAAGRSVRRRCCATAPTSTSGPHRDRAGHRRPAARRRTIWSAASATAGCRICCGKRSRRSTDPGPNWRG